MIKSNPTEGAKQAKAYMSGIRDRTYDIAAGLYAYALTLMADEEERQNFYEQLYPVERKNQINTEYIILHVFQYGYDKDARGNEHGRAMRKFHDMDLEIGVEDIPSYLRDNGGFDRLLKRRVSNEAIDLEAIEDSDEEPASEGNADGDDFDGAPIEEEEGEAIEAEPPCVAPPKLKQNLPGASRVGKVMLKVITRTMLLRHLIVEADDELFDEVLAMKVGKKRLGLSIEKLADSAVYSANGDEVPFKRIRLSAS